MKMNKFNQDSTLEVKYDWSREEILEILNLPLIDLMWNAQIVHRQFNNYRVQLSTLLSVKTGGCTENCSYCSQSIYSSSQLKSNPLQEVESVLKKAAIAKNQEQKDFAWAGLGER